MRILLKAVVPASIFMATLFAVPTATAQDQSDSCVPDSDTTCDKREDFRASFHVGLGIDSFAAADLKATINPEASSDIQERAVGGFDFQYRLFRLDEGDNPTRRQKIEGAQQLWVYGKTTHGVRSTDVNCADVPNLPVCTRNGVPFDPVTAGSQTIFLIRNATSLEAALGLRYEFMPLNHGFENQASLYFKSEYGFVTISKSGGDVFDNHQWAAIGAIATSGRFRNSFLQLGFGRSDFFTAKSGDRWKIDGYLEWEMVREVHGFAEMYADSDFGHGADSVQTYLGISVDLDELFRK